MQVIHLDPQSIMKYWREIEPAIQLAIDRSVGESTTYDYLDWFQDPEYCQCWVVLDDDRNIINVSTSRINTYPTHKSCHVLTCTSVNGGKWDTYRQAHNAIEEFARERGCRRMELYGRPGWKRKIGLLAGTKNETYKPVYTVYSMELDYE